MPHSSLRPSQRLAPRCGQYWSMTPTTPRLSRNASSSSPITTIFFGGPSASGSCFDSSTGIQKRRSNSPIPVPAPLSVRNLLSSARSMGCPPEFVLLLPEIGSDAARRQRVSRGTARRSVLFYVPIGNEVTGSRRQAVPGLIARHDPAKRQQDLGGEIFIQDARAVTESLQHRYELDLVLQELTGVCGREPFAGGRLKP